MRKMLEADDLPMPDGGEHLDDAVRSTAKGSWWNRDDALWNPFEVGLFAVSIVFGFGFLMGHGKYLIASELFAPAILIGFAMVVAQWIARRKAGEPNVFKVMRNRIG